MNVEEDVPPSILRRSLEPQPKIFKQVSNGGKEEAISTHSAPPSTHFMPDYEDDEEDEELGSSFQSINPLNTNTEGIELETIRNSYKDDLVDSLELDVKFSSSPLPKRPSVFPGHEHEDSDDFSISTMLAIRTAVLAGLRDANKQRVELEDYQTTRKHKTSMAGDRKVEVKDYAPVVFALLRRRFGISVSSYLLSWSDHRLAKSRSQGKSDSMFVHSPDNKFVLKTLNKSEAKRLRKLLQPYYEHMLANEDTFLSRIYGLHRITRRRGQSKVYFFILNNVFETQHRMREIYDLKGSTVGRRAAVEHPPSQRRASTSFDFLQMRKAVELEAKTKEDDPPKKPTVLKDLDFTRKLYVGPENKKKILVQIAADCKFLAEHKLMDYSLLIGIRNPDSPATPAPIPPSDSSSQPQPPRGTTPGSSPEIQPRVVPGLLFFLESTKDASARPASREQGKKTRRKSLSLGKPTFATPEELNAIDEETNPDSADPDSTNADSTAPTMTDSTEGTLDLSHSSSPPSLYDQTDHNGLINQGVLAVISTATAASSITGSITHDDDEMKPSHAGNTNAVHPTDTHDDKSDESTPRHETNKPNDASKADGANREPAHEPHPDNYSAFHIPPTQAASKPNSADDITIKIESTNQTNADKETKHDRSPAPAINIIPASPLPDNNVPNGNGLPKVLTESTDSDIGDTNENENTASSNDSPPNSPPKRSSLGLMTTDSVPTFHYMPNKGVQIIKSGSANAVRLTSSANNTPKLLKKPSRSSSLTYFTALEAQIENTHTPFFKVDDGGMRGSSTLPTDPTKKSEIYYIGIIDFLQKYNKKKMLAGFAKSFKYEKEELSTVDPDFYMERFLKMVDKAIAE